MTPSDQKVQDATDSQEIKVSSATPYTHTHPLITRWLLELVLLGVLESGVPLCWLSMVTIRIWPREGSLPCTPASILCSCLPSSTFPPPSEHVSCACWDPPSWVNEHQHSQPVHCTFLPLWLSPEDTCPATLLSGGCTFSRWSPEVSVLLVP